MVVHGGRELRGRVPISGYKHALTVVVAAAVALDRQVTLRNVPDMTESRVLKDILDHMGATGSLAGGLWRLDTRPMRSVPVPARLSSRIHGSLYLVPALLARFGEVSFVGAGGDRIGPEEQGGLRPVDQVVEVLRRFGATVQTSGGLHARARRLTGCSIDLMEFTTDAGRRHLRGPRVSGATKTALILSAAAQGVTTLRNPLDRDATRELRDFLRVCGTRVSQEDDGWSIEPAGGGGSVSYRLISDSTGIFTFIACAAFVGGSLELTGITGERTWHAIRDELELMERMGVPLTRHDDSLQVRGPGEIRPVEIEIECNGFSTDAHPLLAVPLLRATGVSRITDHVWTNRFAYVRLLEQMGARVEVTGNTVELRPSHLRAPPEPILPTDSRAAAAAVVAALGTRGDTRIEDRGGHLDRSYELLIARLRAVGASVEGNSMDSWPSATEETRNS
jgi:UDP-N-acetylglucosamine 1-carboxyvinyltransferase